MNGNGVYFIDRVKFSPRGSMESVFYQNHATINTPALFQPLYSWNTSRSRFYGTFNYLCFLTKSSSGFTFGISCVKQGTVFSNGISLRGERKIVRRTCFREIRETQLGRMSTAVACPPFLGESIKPWTIEILCRLEEQLPGNEGVFCTRNLAKEREGTSE